MRKAEKKEAREPSPSQTTDNTAKPKVMSFSPLWKLKGTQPAKVLAVWLAHLEEESSKKKEGAESEDPNGIEGVMNKFIVHLTRAVKDAQPEEKHCYHCSSPEYFICECPLVKAARMDSHLNWKEGTAPKKGAQTPQGNGPHQKHPKIGCPRYRTSYTDSLLGPWSLPLMVPGWKHSQGKG